MSVIIGLLVLAALALMSAQMLRGQAERRLVERRLQVRGNAREDARVIGMRFADLFDDPVRIRRHIDKDSELSLALWQAGLRSPVQRATVYGIQVLLPLVVAVITGLWGVLRGFSEETLMAGLFVTIIAVLVPKRVIVARAASRLRAVDEELSLFVQMLRILFDAGLAVEQALRVMVSDSRTVLPVLVEELEPVLRRAEQGLDLEAELSHMATSLNHAGLADTLVIVRQMLKQGGSARASLAKLIELLEQRRLTDMQERVGKLSARMTVVMIVFFFPALIILLAGPGFMSISASLGDF